MTTKTKDTTEQRWNAGSEQKVKMNRSSGAHPNNFCSGPVDLLALLDLLVLLGLPLNTKASACPYHCTELKALAVCCREYYTETRFFQPSPENFNRNTCPKASATKSVMSV